MDNILNKSVKSFMNTNLLVAHENDSLKKLFKTFDKHAILGIPVVNDEKKVVGIITETDLINHFTTLEIPHSINLLGGILYLDDIGDFNQSLKDHCAEKAKDIMKSSVISINENDTLSDAIDLMSENKIKRLPVYNESNELSGMVTRSDIIHQLAKIKSI